MPQSKETEVSFAGHYRLIRLPISEIPLSFQKPPALTSLRPMAGRFKRLAMIVQPIPYKYTCAVFMTQPPLSSVPFARYFCRG